jgi:hypothetical protein
MALKPMGDDAWPEHVAIQELGFHDVFTLVWYYSNLRVNGLHNIETVENPQTRKPNYLQPTYACPGCNQIVLVPFPEVENTKELYLFFKRHVQGHASESCSSVNSNTILSELIEAKVDVPLDDSTIQLIHSGLLVPNLKTIQKMAREIRVSRGIPNPDSI